MDVAAWRRTAASQIHRALLEKGYMPLQTIVPAESGHTLEVRFYGKEGSVLVMQVWEDGGCELFKPCTDSISIQETIDAIP